MRELQTRTRAQRRFRRMGYTWEISTLTPCAYAPKVILIQGTGPWGWRSYRDHLIDYLGEQVRPIAVSYIHNGRKPKGRGK